jgi:hypothetical protein
MAHDSSPGWSVPVRLDDVPESGLRRDLAADAAIRPALARAAGVDELPRLEASFDVTRSGRDGLRVTGSVSATVRQTCVVTLEPVENKVEEAVDLTFQPADEGAGAAPEEGAAQEPPEPLLNGTVDLAAIATEFFILGVDPYPRKAGAVFNAPKIGEPADHPFAALAALKKRP